jgi:hypothetical protein
MEIEEIREIIKRELPRIIEKDEEISRLVIHLTSRYYAGRIETEDRFERMLKELESDREEQSSRWEEENRRWEEQNREQSKRWEEQNRKWEEQNSKWKENQKVIQGLYEQLMLTNRRLDQSIGALGARWGLRSEESFRNALRGILESSFGVQVLHINEFDDQGEVFGKPDQVEIDLIIKDGLLILCEITSSMSRADVYVFERKTRFYENRHNCKATRRMIISPMIEDKAKKVARLFGIEMYSYAEDVEDI